MIRLNRLPRSLSAILALASLYLLTGCGGAGDDDSAGNLVLTEDSYRVFENAGDLLMAVDRVNGSSGVVTVDYATEDGTALASVDYITAAGTLTFNDGVTRQNISIGILDNSINNGDRSFGLRLSNTTGGAGLLAPMEARVEILDDESVPIYNFESLALTDINGQDNWLEPINNATIVNDVLINGTQVVRPNVISGLAGETELTRVNNVNFTYTPFTLSAGEIWFDATADDNAIFALGQDIDKDGVLEAANNEIGVPFGFWERQFAIFAANNLVSRVVGLRDSDDAPTDWYRLRLRIDFDANSGDGSVSLSYKNLSKGDADFTDVANLQDINARLRQNGAPNQAAWDAMFLKLRVDATNIPKVDNLIPNVPLSP